MWGGLLLEAWRSWPMSCGFLCQVSSWNAACKNPSVSVGCSQASTCVDTRAITDHFLSWSWCYKACNWGTALVPGMVRNTCHNTGGKSHSLESSWYLHRQQSGQDLLLSEDIEPTQRIWWFIIFDWLFLSFAMIDLINSTDVLEARWTTDPIR